MYRSSGIFIGPSASTLTEAKQRTTALCGKPTALKIAKISKGGIPPIQSKQQFGTYAYRELVIACAAWISAAFHLKVIRVFLASVTSFPTRSASDQPGFITPMHSNPDGHPDAAPAARKTAALTD